MGKVFWWKETDYVEVLLHNRTARRYLGPWKREIYYSCILWNMPRQRPRQDHLNRRPAGNLMGFLSISEIFPIPRTLRCLNAGLRPPCCAYLLCCCHKGRHRPVPKSASAKLTVAGWKIPALAPSNWPNGPAPAIGVWNSFHATATDAEAVRKNCCSKRNLRRGNRMWTVLNERRIMNVYNPYPHTLQVGAFFILKNNFLITNC